MRPAYMIIGEGGLLPFLKLPPPPKIFRFNNNHRRNESCLALIISPKDLKEGSTQGRTGCSPQQYTLLQAQTLESSRCRTGIALVGLSSQTTDEAIGFRTKSSSTPAGVLHPQCIFPPFQAAWCNLVSP